MTIKEHIINILRDIAKDGTGNRDLLEQKAEQILSLMDKPVGSIEIIDEPTI